MKQPSTPIEEKYASWGGVTSSFGLLWFLITARWVDPLLLPLPQASRLLYRRLKQSLNGPFYKQYSVVHIGAGRWYNPIDIKFQQHSDIGSEKKFGSRPISIPKLQNISLIVAAFRRKRSMCWQYWTLYVTQCSHAKDRRMIKSLFLSKDNICRRWLKSHYVPKGTS